jgi:hypothetical protein
MDETRRFLRYVVPALAFLTEVALLLLLTQKGCLIGSVSTRLRTGGAGFAALILVMAGGFGYLFSLLHHTFFWCCGKYGIDYSEFVRVALNHGWLRLVTDGERDTIAGERVTRLVAWDVVTLLWHHPGRAEDTRAPELGEVFIRRMDAMSDLMLGLGTDVMATGFVWFAWAALYFWLCHEPLPLSRLVLWWHVLLSIILAGVFIWLHLSNYIRVRNQMVGLVTSALATHFSRVDTPAVIFVDRSVLDSDPCPIRSKLRWIWTTLRHGLESP